MPEHGYQHREHRSKRGRNPNYWNQKKLRLVEARARKSKRRPPKHRIMIEQ